MSGGQRTSAFSSPPLRNETTEGPSFDRTKPLSSSPAAWRLCQEAEDGGGGGGGVVDVGDGSIVSMCVLPAARKWFKSLLSLVFSSSDSLSYKAVTTDSCAVERFLKVNLQLSKNKS